MADMDDALLYIHQAGNEEQRKRFFDQMLGQHLRAENVDIENIDLPDIPDDFLADNDLFNVDAILPEIAEEDDEVENDNEQMIDELYRRHAELMDDGPPIPEGSGVGKAYRKALWESGQATDPALRRMFLENAVMMLLAAYDRAAPPTKRRRLRMGVLYHEFLKLYLPSIPKERYWKKDVVKKYCMIFLLNLATFTKGRNGELVRSLTFTQWVTDMASLIGRYCTDDDGTKIGSEFLAGGFLEEMQNRASYIIKELGLNRFPSVRGYIGRAELQMIYQHAFERTEVDRRMSFLQTLLATNIAFHTGCRVGSLGWSEKEYRDQGLYLKLKDLDFDVVEKGCWDMDIRFRARKGINTANNAGRPLSFKIQHVKHLHNAWFDTATIALVLLVARGALVDIETLNDLFAHDKVRIKIKPEFMEEPLFFERGPQGLTLTKNPCSAKSLGESLRNLGRAAGMRFSTFHCIRRDAANIFGLIVGATRAQLILGHGQPLNVFYGYYSKSTYNENVSGIRLGDYDHTVDEITQIALLRHYTEGIAVEAILSTPATFGLVDTKDEKKAPKKKAGGNGEGEDEDEDEDEDKDEDEGEDGDEDEDEDNSRPGQSSKTRKDITPAQRKEIREKNPKAKEVDDILRAHWDKFWGFLPRAARGYKERLEQIRFILQNKSVRPAYLANQKEIDAHIKVLKDFVQKKWTPVWQKAKQPYYKAEAEAKVIQAKNRADDQTTEMRARAIELLSKPSSLFRPTREMDADLKSAYKKAFGTESVYKDLQNPGFGEGFLTDECIAALRDKDIYNMIESHDSNIPVTAEEEAGDEILSIGDGQLLDPANLPVPPPQAAQNDPELADVLQQAKVEPFNDETETPIFKGDRDTFMRIFAYRLLRPIFALAAMERARERNGKMYRCDGCDQLGHVKPSDWQADHPSRSRLKRHIAQLHSPWIQLMAKMLTADEDVFKCPTESCDFTGPSIRKVQNHCLEECSEKDGYGLLYDAHQVWGHGPMRPLSGTTSRLLALQVAEGLPLANLSIKTLQDLSVMDVDKYVEGAMQLGVDDESTRARGEALKEMCRRCLEFLPTDGVLINPDVHETIDELYARVMTPTRNAFLQRSLDRVINSEDPDVQRRLAEARGRAMRNYDSMDKGKGRADD